MVNSIYNGNRFEDLWLDIIKPSGAASNAAGLPGPAAFLRAAAKRTSVECFLVICASLAG